MAQSPFISHRPMTARQSVEAVARRLTKGFSTLAALTFGALATACTTAEPLGGPLAVEVAAPTPRAALTRIASGAARCWTRGAIADYAVIPELDTTAGNPRILLIEKASSSGLPALVIEGGASPTRLRSFGPLATEPLSNRINADIIRWSTGGAGCRGRA